MTEQSIPKTIQNETDFSIVRQIFFELLLLSASDMAGNNIIDNEFIMALGNITKGITSPNIIPYMLNALEEDIPYTTSILGIRALCIL